MLTNCAQCGLPLSRTAESEWCTATECGWQRSLPAPVVPGATREEIQALWRHASASGDDEVAADCRRGLDGDGAAWCRSAALVAAARKS